MSTEPIHKGFTTREAVVNLWKSSRPEGLPRGSRAGFFRTTMRIERYEPIHQPKLPSCVRKELAERIWPK